MLEWLQDPINHPLIVLAVISAVLLTGIWIQQLAAERKHRRLMQVWNTTPRNPVDLAEAMRRADEA